MPRNSAASTAPLRPNRRYRRLLPAVLATATVVSGLPSIAPTARAAAPPRVHVAPAPARKAVVPRVPTVRDPGAPQDTGTK